MNCLFLGTLPTFFLSEFLTPPITLTLPFLRSPLTFFRLPFLHHFFLRLTLKLNPLSSQNHSCNRSGVSFSIFKYSAIFILNAVLFSGFLLDSRLYLAQM